MNFYNLTILINLMDYDTGNFFVEMICEICPYKFDMCFDDVS